MDGKNLVRFAHNLSGASRSSDWNDGTMEYWVHEVTKRGEIVAIVTSPGSPNKIDPQEFLGCLHGTVTFAPDWDGPLGEDDWEACR